MLEHVVEPLSRRVGTAVAVYLVSQGVAQDLASAIAVLVAVALGVSCDLIASRLARER